MQARGGSAHFSHQTQFGQNQTEKQKHAFSTGRCFIQEIITLKFCQNAGGVKAWKIVTNSQFHSQILESQFCRNTRKLQTIKGTACNNRQGNYQGNTRRATSFQVFQSPSLHLKTLQETQMVSASVLPSKLALLFYFSKFPIDETSTRNLLCVSCP